MGFKIVKLHGCSGAGKTTVARSVLTSANVVHRIVPEGAKRPEAYACEFVGADAPIIVLGSYENNCGGMDSVPKAETAMKLVKEYHELGHVLHEGLLQSTYYGAMGIDSQQYGDDYIYAFLDTPIMTCLERVTHRRDVQQSKNKFNPQLTVDKYNTIASLKEKLIKKGDHRVVTFRYNDDPLGQLKTLFFSGS